MEKNISLLAITLPILILQIALANSFLSSDLCIIPDEIHRDVQCTQYQCSEGICSKDKQKCQWFVSWTNLLDRYKTNEFAKNTLDTYQKFVVSINFCSKEQYEPLETEACLNKKVCLIKKKWTSRLMFEGVDIVEKRACPCKGKHKVDCKNGYCSTNKKTCQRIFDQKMNNTSIVKQIRVCK